MKCKIEDCNDEVKYAGLCGKHYKRQWRHGDAKKTLIDMGPKTAECSVEGCTRTVFTNKSGLCTMHYTRYWRYGRTENIIADDGSGTLNAAGYKVYTVNGHPFPDKAVVHHHYGNPSTLVICPNQAYHLLLHARMRG